MRHRKDNEIWDYLMNKLAADVSLIQEASDPGMHGISKEGYVWHEIGGTRRWGSGIVARHLQLDEIKSPGEFKNSYPGALMGARVKLPGKGITNIFSVYGLLDKDPYNESIYSTTTLHRMLSDLTFLLRYMKRKRQHIIFGGDLNASIQFDEKWHNYYANTHKIFFERLADFGLVDCFSRFFSKPIQTFRHSRSSTPWQNDYLFVSREIIDKVKSCEVLSYAEVKQLSDHNPVVIKIDI
jgi:exonuclease III